MVYIWPIRVKEREELMEFINMVNEEKEKCKTTDKVTMGSEVIKALDLYCDIKNGTLKVIGSGTYESIINQLRDKQPIDNTPVPPTPKDSTKVNKKVVGTELNFMYG